VVRLDGGQTAAAGTRLALPHSPYSFEAAARGPPMRLSTYTDYSLRMLMMLAAKPQRRTTVAEVAAAFGVSEHHLGKVAHGLGRHGWVATARGQGGGLWLAMAPARIVIGEVVRRTENGDQPAACFADDSPPCAIAPACRLHDVLDEALRGFYAVLDRYTLADLVRQPHALSRLLFVPEPAR
jgi:Rrf2 family nitric oxide-sensitive transcriptional repressor